MRASADTLRTVPHQNHDLPACIQKPRNEMPANETRGASDQDGAVRFPCHVQNPSRFEATLSLRIPLRCIPLRVES